MDKNQLIIALCREAGDNGDDEEIIDGWTANHMACCDYDDGDGSDIDNAANGDVAALVKVRACCGLPVFV